MTERKQHHDIYETIQITPDAPYPGNDLPVRLYRQALSGSRDTLITGFKRLFTSHGWSEPWINGIYDFHHFHAEAHEVLGCAAGRVTVQLGGPNGQFFYQQASRTRGSKPAQIIVSSDLTHTIRNLIYARVIPRNGK